MEQLKKIKCSQDDIDEDMAATERDITETEGKIQNLDQEIEEDLGPRQKKFKESFLKWVFQPLSIGQNHLVAPLKATNAKKYLIFEETKPTFF